MKKNVAADASAKHLTIGEAGRRCGVAPSALRFYEERGLIASVRTAGNQRLYHRSVLRRISIIRIAQTLGLTLSEISDALANLPNGRTPTKRDWERLSKNWRDRLTERIENLQSLRDKLSTCIGCGCLSMKTCSLHNSGDRAGDRGPGPRYLMGDAARDD